MPSPFPGMDPYLEDPAVWPGFHQLFITEMMAALNRQLLPGYYARIEERVYISHDDDPGRRTIIPDVYVHATERRHRPTRARRGSTKVGVLECEPIEVTDLIDQEIHESFVKIISRFSKEVVTIIEMLSPTNKIAGSVGRQQYEKKRVQVMHSTAHWIELDLLREGVPTIARDVYPRCEYTVHLSRATDRRRATLWPIRLEHRLPRIPIPLMGDEPDAQLELQSVLDSVYDRAVYSVDLDYTNEPTPPLRPDLAKWSHKLLKQKKLRRA